MPQPAGHIGIDTSKAELVCTYLLPRQQRPLWRETFHNTEEGFCALLAKSPTDAVFVIEPTGNYSLGFVKHANNAGRSVLMAPPRKAKSFLASIQSRAKTDKIDSYGLALFAQSQTLRIYPVKSAVVEQLDQLLSARRGISQSITALTQQSQALPHAAEQLEASVTALKEQLKAIDKEIAKASAADATLQNTVRLLRKAHGIGPVTAPAVAACLTSKQFATPAQFVAYIGLDVGIVQSGKSKGQVGLTKQGNAELRRLFYLAAQATLRTKDSPFKEQYKQLRERGRKHKEAITIMSRKLAKLCWSIAKNQSEFDADRIFTRPSRQDSELEHSVDSEVLSEQAIDPECPADLTQS